MYKNLNELTDIEKIAKVWQFELNIEHEKPEKNVRLSFKDIGPFCEYLATYFLPGYVGGGSGGMGFDLVNMEQETAFEIKSCCTIQNAKCSNCGMKFNNLFHSICPNCKNSKFKEIHDSRFGINADETLRQLEKEILEGFLFCHISKISHDNEEGILNIKVEWFKLLFDGNLREIQLKYFKTQAEQGRKSHCNLLPNKIDFYKLCPLKFYEATILINYKDLNTTPQIEEKKCNEYPRVPVDIFYKKEQPIVKALSSYDKETNTVDCLDFSINFDYRIKTLGKERGDTRKNMDKRIKKSTSSRTQSFNAY